MKHANPLEFEIAQLEAEIAAILPELKNIKAEIWSILDRAGPEGAHRIIDAYAEDRLVNWLYWDPETRWGCFLGQAFRMRGSELLQGLTCGTKPMGVEGLTMWAPRLAVRACELWLRDRGHSA